MGESFITSRGYGYSKITFNIYPVELVRSTATELSEARYNIAATTVGNYALFGGGDSDNGYSAVVDAYDTKLTRSTPTALSEARDILAATTVGNYALFGGGDSNYVRSAVVDAYKSNTGNTSLTVYPGTRYKLWDMQNELTAATMQTLTGSLPLTGYIKVKKANVD